MVRLPEDDPEIFGLWVHAAYTGNIARSEPQMYSQLAKMYVLAEKFLDTRTKNMIIQTVMICSREAQLDGKRYLSSDLFITAIYNGTPLGNQMRWLLVDTCVQGMSERWFAEHATRLPGDFFIDACLQIMKTWMKPSRLSRTDNMRICGPEKYLEG